MSDRVWLVRHAATRWTGRRWCGRTDLPLSPAGRAQAAALAARLAAHLPGDVIVVSSPARRAVQTAERIAAAADRGVEIMDELREVDFGAAEGRTWGDLERERPVLAGAIAVGGTEIDWPGGERSADVRGRLVAVRRRMDSGAAPLVLVTHGGVIRALLTALGSDPPERHHVEPATALELGLGDGTWAVVGRA
jgi:broad specificity phosphatase PhoE